MQRFCVDNYHLVLRVDIHHDSLYAANALLDIPSEHLRPTGPTVAAGILPLRRRLQVDRLRQLFHLRRRLRLVLFPQTMNIEIAKNNETTRKRKVYKAQPEGHYYNNYNFMIFFFFTLMLIKHECQLS